MTICESRHCVLTAPRIPKFPSVWIRESAQYAASKYSSGVSLSTPHFLWEVATRSLNEAMEFLDEIGVIFCSASGSALELFKRVNSDAPLANASNDPCTSMSLYLGANATTVLERIVATRNKGSFILAAHDRLWRGDESDLNHEIE